ncbi:LuxR family transcriptional regulator [Nocardioides sp.]|uniref:ATP-binding protein n=1 Tax=Nocardioides sp. TaxID=35761 RepID=UPI001A2267BC|nr:LuxR family transcriptional regulator [Nocardioides sp.]MBJ7358525.1 AAA family ATPase [Nocardioides sp.]
MTGPPRARRLLERDAELTQGTALLDRLTGGQGGAFCVLGPAGAGKTALLRSLAEDAATRGARTLTATAGELESHAPFGVVRQLLDRAVAEIPASERPADGPAALAAELLMLSEPARPVEQSAMFTSLFWLVDALASARPVALVVDDAQWADEASLLFLRHLLTRLDGRPVLVVVAARDVHPDRRSPALAALVADRDITTVRLQPLTAGAVHAFLEDAWGRPVPEDVSAACAEVTGGNPFLVSTVAELVAPQEDGREPEVDHVRDAVPGSVVDSVVHRLTALPTLERELARWVAVLDTAPGHLVARLAGVEAQAVAEAADRLRDAGLLAPDDLLEYRHALLRSAVYASIPVGARSLLHRRAARALADEPDGLHRAAAQLLVADGQGEEWAVAHLVRAATAATDSGAPEAAARLLERAVAEPPGRPELPLVLLQLGMAQLRAGDAACVESLERAEQLVDDPVQRAQCALALSIAYNFGGFYDRSADLLERALSGLSDADGDLALVVEACLVAAALQVPGRVAGARRRLDARSGLTGATPGERIFLAQQASYANATDVELSRVLDTVRLAIGDGLTPEQHPDTHEWAVIRLQLAATGQYAEVVALCDRGLEVSAAAGSVIGFVSGSLVRGVALLWSGDLVGAELDLRNALAHADLIPGGTLVGAMAGAFLAELLVERGEVGDALSLVESLDDDESIAFNGGIHLLRARGFVRGAAGDHEAALRDLDECAARLAALEVDSPTWCSWRPVAVASRWALGDVDGARGLAREDVLHAERKAADVALGVALRVEGQVTAEEDPVPVLERAVEVLSGTESRLELARAQVALGAALRRAGRRTEARPVLAAGRLQATRSGATALARLAEEELAAAGGRPRRLEITGTGALTASERRVCELAVAGLRNREIAQRLFIAPKTVEVHLSRAYRKLDIARREQLAAALEGSLPEK